MTYTTCTLEEFSEEAIKGAMRRLQIEPPEDIDYKKFLENTETTIAYFLEYGDLLEELGHSPKVNTRLRKKYKGQVLEIRFNDNSKKIDVTIRDEIRPEKEGSFCYYSYVDDTDDTIVKHVSNPPLKVSFEILPTLLNTPLQHFAKSKLQGLL